MGISEFHTEFVKDLTHLPRVLTFPKEQESPCPNPGVGSHANLLSVVVVTLGTMAPAPGYDPREAGPEPALQPLPPPL